MKVRIEQSEENQTVGKGIFSRGKEVTNYFVTLIVELTNEEKAIIQQYDLGDTVVGQLVNTTYLNSLIEEYNATYGDGARAKLKRQIDFVSEPSEFPISLLTDQKGFKRGHQTLRDASDYVQLLKTDWLPKLKKIIDHYGSKSTAPDTFEL